MKKHKILHICWDGDIGGVQRYLYFVLKQPEWGNYHHGVCFLRSEGEQLSSKSGLPVDFFSVGINKGWQLYKSSKLKSIVDNFEPDVIHVHTDSPSFLLQGGRYSNIPLVYTEHGDTLMRTNRRGIKKILWSYFGGVFDQIICNSEFVRKDFIKQYPKYEQKAICCHNPLLESYSNGSHSSKQQGKFIIGFFGRLVEQKNPEALIELCRKFPQDLEYEVHVYGDGPLKESLKQEIEKYQLPIRLFGFTRQPLEKMASVDVAVVPSLYEPFGLVAIEAQSVGTPVIAFKDTGISELVIEGKTGFVVENGNVNQVYDKCLELMKSPQVKQAMGSAAIEHVKENFSIQTHLERLKNIYKKFMK